MFMCLGDLQKEDKRKKDSGWINNVHERIDITVFLKCLCALQESVYLLLNNFFFALRNFSNLHSHLVIFKAKSDDRVSITGKNDR